MNLHEENTKAMIDEVLSLYGIETTKFNKYSRIAARIQNILTIQAGIENCQIILKKGTGGKTRVKTVSRQELTHMALVVCGDLFDFAHEKEDIELIRISSKTLTDFNRMSEVQFSTEIKAIDQAIDGISTRLGETDLTPEKRSNFKDMILTYNSVAGAAGTARGRVTAARERMTALFHQAEVEFDVLDRLMLKFVTEDPDLYTRYDSARKIIDRGGGHGGGGTDTPPPDNPPTPPAQ